MKAFRNMCAVCAAVIAAAFFAPAATFAQDTDTDIDIDLPEVEFPAENLRRAADLVNLMRGVFNPEPDPVLPSPAERAVSGKPVRKATSVPQVVVKTVPVVTVPEITVPDEESEPDKTKTVAKAEPDKSAQTAASASNKKTSGDDVDYSDEIPPFSYAFFFGEYVPYFEGWYYYYDRWIWGSRLPRPLHPPGWIPPPYRPLGPFRPDDRPFRPDDGPRPRPGGRTGAASRTQEPVRPNNTIPVVPGAHRIPRSNR